MARAERLGGDVDVYTHLLPAMDDDAVEHYVRIAARRAAADRPASRS